MQVVWVLLHQTAPYLIDVLMANVRKLSHPLVLDNVREAVVGSSVRLLTVQQSVSLQSRLGTAGVMHVDMRASKTYLHRIERLAYRHPSGA